MTEQPDADYLAGIYIGIVRLYDVALTVLEYLDKDRAVALDALHQRGGSLMSDPILKVEIPDDEDADENTVAPPDAP